MEDIYYVYALRSEVSGRIYVGFSSDPAKRLKEHNQGRTKSTKGYRPWQLVYVEEVKGRANAPG